MLMAFKIEDDERAAIADAVFGRLQRDLAGCEMRIRAYDASPDRYSDAVAAKVKALSPAVEYRRVDRPLTVSYIELAEACTTPYCYFQFDDQLVTNLSPEFLLAASRLLDRHGDLLPVVTAVWPLEVSVDDEQEEIVVLTHRRHGGDAYRFGEMRRRAPILVEEVDGFTFGIFENFYYGFYFQHIVTRPDDYARRVRWYMDATGSSSAHEIELAASDRTFGPFWTHVAVCLDGMAILDVDFAHTQTSLRPETLTARDVHRALENGFEIRTVHVDG